MNAEYVPARGQKFDIGRTINFAKCDCPECDFLHCPKNNYAVKMVRKKRTVGEFFDDSKEEILKRNTPKRWQYGLPQKFDMSLTRKLIDDLMDAVNLTFPKNTYWNYGDPYLFGTESGDNEIYRSIHIVKFSRNGNEVKLGSVRVADGRIEDIDLNASQLRLAEKLSKIFKDLKTILIDHYRKGDEEWKVGWLSPEGRHYPCSHCEHAHLAGILGRGEILLERDGWVKVALHDPDGFFCNPRMITAEQLNWLSLNGYDTEDISYEQTI